MKTSIHLISADQLTLTSKHHFCEDWKTGNINCNQPKPLCMPLSWAWPAILAFLRPRQRLQFTLHNTAALSATNKMHNYKLNIYLFGNVEGRSQIDKWLTSQNKEQIKCRRGSLESPRKICQY